MTLYLLLDLWRSFLECNLFHLRVKQKAVLVTNLAIFLIGISVSEGWILMAQWTMSSSAEVFYIILCRTLVVCFEEGFSLKYKNIVVFLDFDGEQRT